MNRIILHVDMDAFFAAVEQHDRPELRGRPVVVGAPPDQRGVVAACSYEARAFGIRSAMPSREAGRRCPHAVFLPVNGRRYEEVSRHVMAIFGRFTPLVEPLSIDEAFLDVTGATGMFGDGPAIAAAIKEAIRREIGLTASVGVASNKFLAKLASELNKPDGLTVVPEGRDAVIAWLAPLPVDRLWGVGKVTRRSLAAAGINTVGDVQAAEETRLAAAVGRDAARHLRALAFGADERAVQPEHEEKSISREHTFPRDVDDRAQLEATLKDLTDDVGARLRAAGKRATLAHLKLRWQGFETLTRQRPIDPPASDDFTLRQAALELFRKEELVERVRLIGFGVSGLTTRGAEQLDLFGGDAERARRREEVSRRVDDIRRRFGSRSIGRAGGTETKGTAS